MEYTALGMPAIVARTPAIEAYFDNTMVEYFTSEAVNELAASALSTLKIRVISEGTTRIFSLDDALAFFTHLKQPHLIFEMCKLFKHHSLRALTVFF